MVALMTVVMSLAEHALRFGGDESGATAIEYGFLVLFIALAMITGFAKVGSWLSTTVADIEPYLQ
jgi:Flp pilus assembly pilin Flp